MNAQAPGLGLVTLDAMVWVDQVVQMTHAQFKQLKARFVSKMRREKVLNWVIQPHRHFRWLANSKFMRC